MNFIALMLTGICLCQREICRVKNPKLCAKVKYLDILLYKCRHLSITRIRPATPGYLRSAAAFGFRELQYQTAHLVYTTKEKANNLILCCFPSNEQKA